MLNISNLIFLLHNAYFIGSILGSTIKNVQIFSRFKKINKTSLKSELESFYSYLNDHISQPHFDSNLRVLFFVDLTSHEETIMMDETELSSSSSLAPLLVIHEIFGLSIYKSNLLNYTSIDL